jgi:hypothetical protein
MTKKTKPKKKDGNVNGIFAIANPCGDYCDVQEGHLCPECEDYGSLHNENEDSVKSDNAGPTRN